ncbi:hypothetical protein Tco_0809482 [Tanacetum coccineum]
MDTQEMKQIASVDAFVAPATTHVGKIVLGTAQFSSSLDRFKDVTFRNILVNLEYCRARLRYCLQLPNQQFEETNPFEGPILTFLKKILVIVVRIKVITDVNVNMLNQSWTNHLLRHPDKLKIYKSTYTLLSGCEPQRQSMCQEEAVGLTRQRTLQLLKGNRLKTSAKAAKTAKKSNRKASKDKGLTVLPEQISWKSSDEEDDDEVTLNDDDDDDDDNDDDGNNDDDDDDADNQDAENQDDDDEQTDSDNDEDSFNPRVQTPSHVKSTDDEDNDEEIQDANVEGDKMNEEETNKGAEVDALYKDVNVNLEGRDTEMTDAPATMFKTTQVIEDTHVIITPVNPEGQQQSSSMSSSFVSNMLNPSPGTAVSSISGIVDAYLAKKMHEAVKIAVQLQSERLSDEAQAENADFLNKLMKH